MMTMRAKYFQEAFVQKIPLDEPQSASGGWPFFSEAVGAKMQPLGKTTIIAKVSLTKTPQNQ